MRGYSITELKILNKSIIKNLKDLELNCINLIIERDYLDRTGKHISRDHPFICNAVVDKHNSLAKKCQLLSDWVSELMSYVYQLELKKEDLELGKSEMEDIPEDTTDDTPEDTTNDDKF